MVGDTKFYVHNYTEGKVENSFAFVRKGESDDYAVSGVYQNATLIMNTNSAVLDGTFRINTTIMSAYPNCTTSPVDGQLSVKNLFINPGTRFNL